MPQVVPDAWKPRLRRYLRELHGEERNRLSAKDFTPGQSVLIRFPDGSHVLFRYAFAIDDRRLARSLSSPSIAGIISSR